MSTSDFDREWRLGELFDAAMLARIGPPLAELLGADLAILDRDGGALWGVPAPEAVREALILELEPAGFLASAAARPPQLRSAGRMFTALLRAEARYRMASALHLEAVTQDFETLKLEHSRLLASEARYRKLSEELEARVAAQVATLEARQQMLFQAEKLASVGQLAAGMAHEINNPLGAILQGSQNILRRIGPGLAQNHTVADALGVDLNQLNRYLQERGILRLLEGIREAGARAAKIVADMLSFSRRSEALFALVDIEDMMETVLRLAASDYDLKKKYDFKRIKIERAYDSALRLVYCDKTEIEQVLLNLLKNAAQAMAAAGTPSPRIVLRTARETDYAVLEVIDNGPGMEEKTLKRIFEPFFTTKDVGVGTGLGLSVSYFIVTEQHNGRLSVASKPGQGTRFSIRLPLARETQS